MRASSLNVFPLVAACGGFLCNGHRASSVGRPRSLGTCAVHPGGPAWSYGVAAEARKLSVLAQSSLVRRTPSPFIAGTRLRRALLHQSAFIKSVQSKWLIVRVGCEGKFGNHGPRCSHGCTYAGLRGQWTSTPSERLADAAAFTQARCRPEIGGRADHIDGKCRERGGELRRIPTTGWSRSGRAHLRVRRIR